MASTWQHILSQLLYIFLLHIMYEKDVLYRYHVSIIIHILDGLNLATHFESIIIHIFITYHVSKRCIIQDHVSIIIHILDGLNLVTYILKSVIFYVHFRHIFFIFTTFCTYRCPQVIVNKCSICQSVHLN